ncbi:Demethylrebeccamycin-D-glucose O-methyltransferase [Roseovarius sp. THAF27]|uniref:class I SAM-dependent methyltransferase n=1 Tax=Roseovarius sp. THAF27 TaxID=2587850 RepID=UPI0012686705|nr:class I SAM-dependent methyltransferase [Roseovarius sp. THAF27]QFT79841.1 Demethylrebeccamycin-D-glucose O-methyltransferase [Roseovarius sp. THAF27]
MTDPTQNLDTDALRAFGEGVDFGRTASDYATHRAGFPPAFFELLTQRGWTGPGQTAVDLGCGTGTVARGLAGLGLDVTGIDPAQPLLDEARKLDRAAGVEITYKTGTAEATGLAAASADLVTAGQCWHWFDRPAAAAEVARLLRPGGRAVIAHFDWLPLPGNVVAATEALILRHNPGWAGAGGTGIYPAWLTDLAQAGLTALETASVDVSQPYTHVAWRGRIRASAGVAASLDAERTSVFDAELAALLRREFPDEPMSIPHRIWLATGVLDT